MTLYNILIMSVNIETTLDFECTFFEKWEQWYKIICFNYSTNTDASKFLLILLIMSQKLFIKIGPLKIFSFDIFN